VGYDRRTLDPVVTQGCSGVTRLMNSIDAGGFETQSRVAPTIAELGAVFTLLPLRVRIRDPAAGLAVKTLARIVSGWKGIAKLPAREPDGHPSTHGDFP
jgi:hypothetical protein